MLLKIYIATIIMSFVLDIIDRFVRKKDYTNGFTFLMTIVISLTPVINVIFGIISIFEISTHYNDEKNEKNKKLKKYNKFMECKSCKVIVRNAYIIESEEKKCPVCKDNKNGYEEVSEDDYIANEKIPEQAYISDIKKFREEKLLKRVAEQEEFYFKALEKSLQNHD